MSVWDSETFELSLVTVFLPIGIAVTDELGNSQSLTEKVTFHARFPPTSNSLGRLVTDLSSVQSEVIVTGRTLKPLDPRVRPGLKCVGNLNGVDGSIEIMPVAQNSVKEITRELGHRICIKFMQDSRGVSSA